MTDKDRITPRLWYFTSLVDHPHPGFVTYYLVSAGRGVKTLSLRLMTVCLEDTWHIYDQIRWEISLKYLCDWYCKDHRPDDVYEEQCGEIEKWDYPVISFDGINLELLHRGQPMTESPSIWAPKPN